MPRITERKKKKKQKLPKDAKVDEMSVCCNERESRAAFFFFPLFQKSIEHSLTTALSLLFGCTGHKAAAVAIGNGKEQLKIFMFWTSAKGQRKRRWWGWGWWWWWWWSRRMVKRRRRRRKLLRQLHVCDRQVESNRLIDWLVANDFGTSHYTLTHWVRELQRERKKKSDSDEVMQIARRATANSD